MSGATDSSSLCRAWQQALQRFTAHHLLFLADNDWGPLYQATFALEGSHGLARSGSGGEREQWKARHRADSERHERELERHMAQIYDPLIASALALVRTPAPDLAAVRIKHDVIASELRLTDHAEDDELFAIIKADIARITGVDASSEATA